MEGLAKSKNVTPNLYACHTEIRKNGYFGAKSLLKGKFSEFFYYGSIEDTLSVHFCLQYNVARFVCDSWHLSFVREMMALRSSSICFIRCGCVVQQAVQQNPQQIKPGIKRVQALADISRSGYVVIATKPVHRLQICPIVHDKRAPATIPHLHPGPCSSVGMRRGTDRQTHRRP